MARIKLTLKRIDPVKAGIIYGALMALLALIIVLPMMLLISASGMAAGEMGPMFGGGIAMLFIPVIYGIIGFIAGLVGTALLNFILSKTKGLDIEFDGKDMEISQIGEDNVTF